MNYISDESNIFFYLLTFALGTIFLVLIYYGSRYRKNILDLFRKQNIEPERDINEEWRPYLNTILSRHAKSKLREHYRTLAEYIQFNEIRDELVNTIVLPYDSPKEQELREARTDNERIRILLLKILSKGTYMQLEVFLEALRRSGQEALIQYLPGLDEYELEIVKEREAKLKEVNANLHRRNWNEDEEEENEGNEDDNANTQNQNEAQGDDVQKMREEMENKVKAMNDEMAEKMTQNLEDLKTKFEATKTRQESTTDEEMQQRQRDREQIMNAMQGLRIKVEEKQTELKERMDDIEIDTTENFDYLQKMDEDYKELYDVLSGLINSSNEQEDTFNAQLEEMKKEKQEFERNVQDSIEDLHEYLQSRFAEASALNAENATKWRSLEMRITTSARNTLFRVNRIKTELEEKLRRLEDTEYLRDEEMNQRFEELVSRFENTDDSNPFQLEEYRRKVQYLDETIESQSEMLTSLDRCYLTVSEKVKPLTVFDAFCVRMETPDILERDKQVFFDQIQLNSTHFNILNSCYTCPYNGIYQFNAAIALKRGSATISLQINAKNVMDLIVNACAKMNQSEEGMCDQSSDSISVACKQGDQVTIVVTQCSENAKVLTNKEDKAVGSSWSGKVLYLTDHEQST